MGSTTAVDDVKERSDDLLKRFHEFRDKVQKASFEPEIKKLMEEQKASFEPEIKKLMEEMEALSGKVKSTGDYLWLSQAADQWQGLCFSADLPINTALSSPPQTLRGSRRSKRPMSKDEVDQWIRSKAYYLGRDRNAQMASAIVAYIQERAAIVGSILSEPRQLLDGLGYSGENEEAKRDWCSACACFASEVLDGSIGLGRELTAESYCYLEDVWLQDVKELKAYFLWCSKGGGWGSYEKDSYYYEACKGIEGRLTSQAKESPADFGMVRDYINERYLTEGKIPTGDQHRDRRPAAGLLMKNKARRLCDKTGSTGEIGNWAAAESYVAEFYSNIVPAVEQGNSDGIAAVTAALRDNHLIANAFEMAVGIHFL